MHPLTLHRSFLGGVRIPSGAEERIEGLRAHDSMLKQQCAEYLRIWRRVGVDAPANAYDQDELLEAEAQLLELCAQVAGS